MPPAREVVRLDEGVNGCKSLRFGPANALHCNRPLEYAGPYLSKKSGAVQTFLSKRAP